VPGERPEDDPFDKNRLRRLKLIYSFLVLMREIKLEQFVKGKTYQWPPHIASSRQERQPDKQVRMEGEGSPMN
jgi:hypothetical protein